SLALFGVNFYKLNELCQRAQSGNLNVKGSGLYGKCNVAADSTLFVSLPYNDNFVVKVNGVQVPYSRALTGFVSFTLPQGEDEIEITFIPKGLVLGVVISSLGLVVFVLYLRFYRRLDSVSGLDNFATWVMVVISGVVFTGVYIVPVVIKIFCS
ncbi:YfhO family protein, partial [bacterium]|nr:YfhO family protein [bacterium]